MFLRFLVSRDLNPFKSVSLKFNIPTQKATACLFVVLFFAFGATYVR